VREFFNKNAVIKTFMAGIEKKDERIFLNDVKAQ
jgi:hypothetical protein